MKNQYTYPFGFREVAYNGECNSIYTVNPGIPVSIAMEEVACILDCIYSILVNQPASGAHVDTVQSLVDIARNEIHSVGIGGFTLADTAESAGNTLVDANNTLAQYWGEGKPIPIKANEEPLYGAMLLLNMAIGLCKSILESCKRGLA